ncbi:MAG: HAD family phosphatase [Chloroflexota bacterium]
MIKAIIFDVGGVLIRTEDRSFRAKLEEDHGLEPGESEIMVFNGKAGKNAQLGFVTSDELYATIQGHLGLDQAGIEAFKAGFWGGDRLDTDLIDYIRSLKSNYTTAIISNFMDALPQMLKTDYPAADAFHFTVVSAHVGIMKPDPEIFEYTLQLLNLEPEETVFIDDFEHNVEGCRAVGMHGIHFQAGVDVPAELAKLGVTP